MSESIKKFHSGDLSAKDDQRSGRSIRVDNDTIKALIERVCYTTVYVKDREITERLTVSPTAADKTVLNSIRISIFGFSKTCKRLQKRNYFLVSIQ